MAQALPTPAGDREDVQQLEAVQVARQAPAREEAEDRGTRWTARADLLGHNAGTGTVRVLR